MMEKERDKGENWMVQKEERKLRNIMWKVRDRENEKRRTHRFKKGYEEGMMYKRWIEENWSREKGEQKRAEGRTHDKKEKKGKSAFFSFLKKMEVEPDKLRKDKKTRREIKKEVK